MEKLNKNFKKLTHKGVSLIVLIVTIIVIVILAATVILTLSKNNPIEGTREARFKEDVRTFQDELALAISKDYAQKAGQRDGKFNGVTLSEIKNYIPSFNDSYDGKFEIVEDELQYLDNKFDDKEIKWLEQLNIAEKISLLPYGYIELEYIESTGTQYIDTGYTFKENSKLQLDINIESSNIMGYSDVPNVCLLLCDMIDGRIVREAEHQVNFPVYLVCCVHKN